MLRDNVKIGSNQSGRVYGIQLYVQCQLVISIILSRHPALSQCTQIVVMCSPHLLNKIMYLYVLHVYYVRMRLLKLCADCNIGRMDNVVVTPAVTNKSNDSEMAVRTQCWWDEWVNCVGSCVAYSVGRSLTMNNLSSTLYSIHHHIAVKQ